MKTKIQLNGLVRNIPDDITPDGSLHEKINLRTVDGVMRPVGEKTVLKTGISIDYSSLYVHSIDTITNYIAYNLITGDLLFWNTGSNITIANIGIGKAIDFRSVGKVLIVNNDTDKTLSYCIWNETVYNYRTKISPDVLDIEFSGEIIHHTGTLGVDIYDVTSSYSYNDPRVETTGVVDSMLNQLKDTWRKDGLLLGFVMLQYAWKMYDGSFVKYSNPVLMYFGTIPSIEPYQNSSDGYHYPVYNFAPAKLVLQIEDTTYNSNIIGSLSDYTDLIESLCIFITKPFEYVTYHAIKDTSGTIIYPYYDLQDPDWKNGISYIENSIFYNVKEIGLSDVVSSLLTYPIVFEVGDLGDLNDLTSREVMTIDNYTAHTLFGESMFEYNSRLILLNTIETLGKPFKEFIKDQIAPFTYIDIMFAVKLKTNFGTNIVLSDIITYDSSTIYLPKMLTYPDSRATDFYILTRVTGTTNWQIDVSVKLKKCQLQNWAYSLIKESPTLAAIECITTTDSELQGKTSSTAIHSIVVFGTVYNPIENDTIYDLNRVQASDISNPFTFPAKNSYQVGNSMALAAESNSIPVTQGQFGSHPIFVFTKNGIYALSLGTGEVFVQTITPVNGDVLLDKYSLVNTGTGIIFIDKDYHVRVLTGLSSQIISDVLNVQEGILMGDETYDIYDPLGTNAEYQFFTSDSRLSSAVDYLSLVPFYKYVQEALITWDSDSRREELIITNNDYSYSYVFSFKSKSWFKVTGKYRLLARNFPSFLGVDENNNLVDLSSEYYPYTLVDELPVKGKKEIFIETRSIKFGEEAFKKINRLLLHCYAEIDTDKYLSVYLFGSEDGEKWNFLSGRQQNGTFSNVILSSELVSCKYYRLVITGEISKDSYLSYIDAEITPKYTNKLR